MWELLMSFARSYVEDICDTSPLSAHNVLSQVQTAYCFSSAVRAPSLARSLAAARAEKKPRETIIIAMCAASSLPRHSRERDRFLAPALWNILAILSRLTHSFVRAALHSWSALCNHVALIARVRTYIRRVHVPLQRRYYTPLLSVASTFFPRGKRSVLQFLRRKYATAYK